MTNILSNPRDLFIFSNGSTSNLYTVKVTGDFLPLFSWVYDPSSESVEVYNEPITTKHTFDLVFSKIPNNPANFSVLWRGGKVYRQYTVSKEDAGKFSINGYRSLHGITKENFDAVFSSVHTSFAGLDTFDQSYVEAALFGSMLRYVYDGLSRG